MLIRNKIRSSRSDRLFNILNVLFVLLVVLIVAYPLYFMIIASFSDPRLVSNGSVIFFPKGVTFKGYAEVFKDNRIWLGYRNTIFYSITGTIINLLVTVPAAYALSRKDFYARNGFTIFFVITMFVGGGLIPTFITINKLGLNNKVWVMLIPFCLNVYNMVIVRTFFETSLPLELLEAARIDGCSNNRFFLVIALPLSKAILSVIGLYYFVGRWNEYFMALIYLRDANLIPLQLVLRDILVRNIAFQSGIQGGDAAQQLANIIKYAVIIVSTLPLLVIYPFIQKYFEKGVMIGALKG